MAERLQDARVALSEALERLGGRLTGGDNAPEDLASIRARADALRDDLGIVGGADDPRYVHFIETRGRGVLLRAAPIDASSIIRDTVLAPRHATLLTSATLTVEGSFSYALDRLGAGEAATLKLPAEFDYASQAVLYLPSGMPDPRSPASTKPPHAPFVIFLHARADAHSYCSRRTRRFETCIAGSNTWWNGRCSCRVRRRARRSCATSARRRTRCSSRRRAFGRAWTWRARR